MDAVLSEQAASLQACNALTSAQLADALVSVAGMAAELAALRGEKERLEAQVFRGFEERVAAEVRLQAELARLECRAAAERQELQAAAALLSLQEAELRQQLGGLQEEARALRARAEAEAAARGSVEADLGSVEAREQDARRLLADAERCLEGAREELRAAQAALAAERRRGDGLDLRLVAAEEAMVAAEAEAEQRLAELEAARAQLRQQGEDVQVGGGGAGVAWQLAESGEEGWTWRRACGVRVGGWPGCRAPAIHGRACESHRRQPCLVPALCGPCSVQWRVCSACWVISCGRLAR